MRIFICALGLYLILEGLPYFAFPGRIKSVLAQIGEMPEGTLRLFGFFAMIAGLAMVYFGTR
ncbi:MAG: DUF2065 domain-containing protein [Syntrophales bacterium]|nr:DUF2065 domain-containing protein [Syntrophales bacterium]MDD5232303.1 DUF2065 domain-containing protein [Syntrophales bacterium]MDD5532731.1 DUF2065 domain-containing protein [Syntrophales bacterium]HPL62584.1 DUF2065 domain-containing protein [Syntrophales bacterium]